MGQIIELSIMIVNYQNIKLVQQLLWSIVKFETKLSYEVIVIDNDPQSNDGAEIIEIFPFVRYFQMGYNSGFGRANNKGINEAKGEYILLLNSDTFIKNPNTLRTMLEVAKFKNIHEKCIVGTRLTNADGTFQKTMRISYPGLKELWWRNPIYIFFIQRLFKKDYKASYEKKEYNAHQQSNYAAWINAACIMGKRQNIIEDKLFFDKDFFLYSEDVEWCRRAQQKGYRFWHEQTVELIHLGSASMPSEFLKRAQIKLSEWLFFRKSYGFFYLLLYFLFEMGTELLSGLLYFLSRKAKLNAGLIIEAKYRKVYWYLMLKYAMDILFLRKLSSERNFKLNCYENKVIQKISKGLA